MSELVRRLDPRRWEVHLVCFRREGEWFARTAANVASVAAFPVRSFKDRSALAAMHAFAAWCRERHIAVVHTSELYSNVLFLPAAALGRVPVRIGSRREINAGKSAAQLALQRASYACAHRIVANAEAVASRLRREGVPAHRIAVVPNGLEIERAVARPVRGALRHVVMVANLRPEKGHDVLIDAVPHVLKRFPDARFHLVGGGSERSRLEQRVRETGVTHAVTFHGHVEDVHARLAEADIAVLPSRSEAFPNAVLEAMAARLPVIASAIGGVVEVIEQSRTGLLVAPGHTRELADAICRLMADAALAGTLAANGHHLALARYSFDRMVRAVDRLYVAELTRRAPRSLPQSLLAPL